MCNPISGGGSGAATNVSCRARRHAHLLLQRLQPRGLDAGVLCDAHRGGLLGGAAFLEAGRESGAAVVRGSCQTGTCITPQHTRCTDAATLLPHLQLRQLVLCLLLLASKVRQPRLSLLGLGLELLAGGGESCGQASLGVF
jgi:hypothetical protein